MVNIKLKKVNKIFGSDVHVLKDVDLEIKDKEFMVLVGPSGCGKSTCLNIIAGLEYVTDGKVLFDDIDVTYIPPKERKVAMVFQSYALYPHMNVRENMSFSLRLARTDHSLINKRVNEAAEILGISELLERKPKELSGGQRQRVALGRCIVRNPTVFLFDEPLSNLDAKLRIQMRGELIRLQKKLGITQVYVTHDQVEAMSMADRIAILYDGVFQQIGTPDEVYNYPANKFVAGFIGSPPMNFIDVKFNQNNGNVLEFADIKYPIPDDISNKLIKASPDNLILGIRPEHIKITPDPHQDSYKTKICVIEYLGAETMVTVDLSDKVSIIISAQGFYKGRMDDEAYVSFSTEKIHVFDRQTEKNLIHAPSNKQ
ncbi:MAG: ABC transporter ATP-binding protein [Promethearchaeota archaeon]